jgi:hypothetical protein
MTVKKEIQRKIISLLLTMFLTISVMSLAVPKAAHAYTYPFSKSYFVYDFSSTSMQNFGKNEFNSGGMVVLLFGSPATQSGVYGVSNFGNGFKSNAQVAQAVNDFITGYNSVSTHTQSIKVAVGLTNSLNNIPPTSWTMAGQNWVQMIENNITATGKITFVEAAIDIETSWAKSDVTRNLVDGFNDALYNKKATFMYNIGDNGGNYDKTGVTYSDLRNNGWTTSDIWYVSYGASKNYAMPQIYYDASIPGYANMSNQWWHVALWAYNNSKSMSFSGLLSKDGLPSSGTQATLTADASYDSLKTELAKDARTTQSSFVYPSVILN